MTLCIGTARAKPGRLAYGTLELVEHPTGGGDHLPVVIAQGDPAGPVFWLTAGIHGVEHAGVLVVHQLLTAALARRLHGTVIALPVLNPAGLRTMRREAYYHEGDPNRLFPDGRPAQPEDPDVDPPSALEQAYGRLFALIQETGDYLIDLHNAWTNSVSFVFRDRIFYRNDGPAPRRQAARAAAVDLDRRVGEMCAAYGHSVVNELPPAIILEQRLHRSASAAALNVAHIPAVTAELSTGHMPDPRVIGAAAAGLRNVFRWAQMLEGAVEQITGITVVEPGYACRRRPGPRVRQACIVRHRVEPGDLVRRGDPIAELYDAWGRPVGEKLLRSDYDGWIMGRTHGIAYYPGTEVCGLAIRDDLPTVQPYPRHYGQA